MYLIKQMLGSGFSAIVYLAKHRVTGIKYAIKIYNNKFETCQFNTEVFIHSKLNHPNIVKLIDWGQNGTLKDGIWTK